MAKHSRKLSKKKLHKQPLTTKSNKTSNVLEKKSIDDDSILNFLNLCTNFMSHLTEFSKSWKVTLEDCLVFYKIDVSDHPAIVVSIKIDENLEVQAFTQYGVVNTKYLNLFLNQHLRLEHWSQLKSLLQYLEKENKWNHVSIKNNLIHASKNLRECLESKSLAEDNIGLKAKLQFIFSQIYALTENKYTNEVIFLAYSIYLKSSNCYSYLQKLESIILPKEEDLIKHIHKDKRETL